MKEENTGQDQEPKQTEEKPVVVKQPVITKPIISGVDQHVVLSQEDIDARQ